MRRKSAGSPLHLGPACTDLCLMYIDTSKNPMGIVEISPAMQSFNIIESLLNASPTSFLAVVVFSSFVYATLTPPPSIRRLPLTVSWISDLLYRPALLRVRGWSLDDNQYGATKKSFIQANLDVHLGTGWSSEFGLTFRIKAAFGVSLNQCHRFRIHLSQKYLLRPPTSWASVCIATYCSGAFNFLLRSLS